MRQMHVVIEKQAKPMVIFTRYFQADSIDAAVKTGAAAYVIDCNDPERLCSLISVARARFNEQSV